MSWGAFTWWAVSGVASAFVGGWVAGCFSDSISAETRATHALAAWALTTLIVVGRAALTAGGSATLAGSLGGPASAAIARLEQLTTNNTGPQTVGQARASSTQAQLDEARRNLAIAMIGSFVALLVGAGAAVAGSQWIPEARVRAT